jgi:hypothetical protein
LIRINEDSGDEASSPVKSSRNTSLKPPKNKTSLGLQRDSILESDRLKNNESAHSYLDAMMKYNSIDKVSIAYGSISDYE